MFDPKVKVDESSKECPKSDSSSSSQQFNSFDVYLASRRALSARARGRGLISARPRPTGGTGGASNRNVDESLAVPEDRIVQCQAVLAGKSRDVIKRELQKTNLDVNMAINNILSRDEGEEPGHPVAPGSLMHPFHHSDANELFSLIEGDSDSSRSDLLNDILSPDRRQSRFAIGRHHPHRHRRGENFGSRTNPDEPPLKISRSAVAGSKDQAGQDIHYDVVEWWPDQSEGDTQFVGTL